MNIYIAIGLSIYVIALIGVISFVVIRNKSFIEYQNRKRKL